MNEICDATEDEERESRMYSNEQADFIGGARLISRTGAI